MSYRPMHEVRVREVRGEDLEKLNEWRWKYTDGDLDLPHGVHGVGVETAVATLSDGKPLASLTGTHVVAADPFIHDPDANPLQVIQALIKLETVIAYQASKTGAVDIYVAIPQHLKPYIKILSNYGYEVTAPNCVIMRKPLRPDEFPQMSQVREKVNAARELEQELVSTPEPTVTLPPEVEVTPTPESVQ